MELLDYTGLVYYHGRLNSYIGEELEKLLPKTDSKLEGIIYRYAGQVDNFSDLPTDAEAGDVYNVRNTDEANKVKAGDNLAWTGTEWDDLSGWIDASLYEQLEDAETDKTDLLDQVSGIDTDLTENYVTEESFDETMAKYVKEVDGLSPIECTKIRTLFEGGGVEFLEDGSVLRWITDDEIGDNEYAHPISVCLPEGCTQATVFTDYKADTLRNICTDWEYAASTELNFAGLQTFASGWGIWNPGEVIIPSQDEESHYVCVNQQVAFSGLTSSTYLPFIIRLTNLETQNRIAVWTAYTLNGEFRYQKTGFAFRIFFNTLYNINNMPC